MRVAGPVVVHGGTMTGGRRHHCMRRLTTRRHRLRTRTHGAKRRYRERDQQHEPEEATGKHPPDVAIMTAANNPLHLTRRHSHSIVPGGFDV